MTVLYSKLPENTEIEIGDLVVITNPWYKNPYKVFISRKTKNFVFGKIKIKDKTEKAGYREIEHKFPKVWGFGFQSYPRNVWSTVEYQVYRKKESQENE